MALIPRPIINRTNGQLAEMPEDSWLDLLEARVSVLEGAVVLPSQRLLESGDIRILENGNIRILEA
jgi:hypothetical protein